MGRRLRFVLTLAIRAAAILACVAAGDVALAASIAQVRDAPRFPRAVCATRPIHVVVLGDSFASGYHASPNADIVTLLGNRLAQARPSSTMTNLSVPGAGIANLPRQLMRAAPGRLDAVLTFAGANDVSKGTDPASIVLDEERILDAVARRNPRATVVVANIPDISTATFASHWSYRHMRLPAQLRWPIAALAAIDSSVLTRAAERRGATVFDLHGLSLRTGARNPALIGPDGLHPSDLGHARIAAYAWPVVADALGLPGGASRKGAAGRDRRACDAHR